MSFLPDVKVLCDACGGRRFNAETLSITYRGQDSIGDVLAMSVDEAVEFFAAHPRIHRALQTAAGRRARLPHARPAEPDAFAAARRSASSWSPSWRDCAREADLAAQGPPKRPVAEPKHTLYVLDEPTVGLHMADVEKLIRVLHRLVDAGNTVVVIEHNLDVIAEADWIIDLGPEGGAGGGRIVAQGSPEAVAKARKVSHTADVLSAFLAERSRA